jgi:glycosyltransferase involved in cell wall biosynthesis
MNQKKISVIIPCYNDGKYIEKAIESVRSSILSDAFECIIVNDGSNDKETLKVFEELEADGINILHQTKNGLGSARNLGIKHASGKYILPLDADNQIQPEVFIHAREMLDKDKSVDVVYTDLLIFGKVNKRIEVGEFNGDLLMLKNYIDACALIRKSSLIEEGLYDENMPFMGHEDWELWIRFFLKKRKFIYLPQIGFKYLMRENSMLRNITAPNLLPNYIYLLNKHPEILKIAQGTYYQKVKENSSFKRYIQNKKLKAVIKILLGKSLF